MLEWFCEGVPYRLPVALETTVPNYAGERWWARCPHCSRRVAIVYWAGTIFACRLCLGLAYTSTREDVFSRICRRTDKVRERYGAPRGLLLPWIVKPDRMRWATFARLLADEVEAIDAALARVRRLTSLYGYREGFGCRRCSAIPDGSTRENAFGRACTRQRA
jgi:hypothetical protein